MWLGAEVDSDTKRNYYDIAQKYFDMKGYPAWVSPKPNVYWDCCYSYSIPIFYLLSLSFKSVTRLLREILKTYSFGLTFERNLILLCR